MGRLSARWGARGLEQLESGGPGDPDKARKGSTDTFGHGGADGYFQAAGAMGGFWKPQSTLMAIRVASSCSGLRQKSVTDCMSLRFRSVGLASGMLRNSSINLPSPYSSPAGSLA